MAKNKTAIRLGNASASQPLVDNLRPDLTGAADVVKTRQNVAMQGKMLHDQLKKNKSAGMKP